MKNILKSGKGLTLIELIAASVIIVIILTGFVTVFTQGASFTEKNDDSLVASNLAREVLVELKASDQDFSFINGNTTFHNFNDSNTPSIDSVNYDGTFKSDPDKNLRLVFSPEPETNLWKVNIEILENFLAANPNSGEIITETYGYVEVNEE